MKTQKAVNKRIRILEAAATVFATKGYSQTTLADIGAQAGTYAGSLYYYFPSKERIVEEVLNIGTTSVSNLVMAKVATLDSETGIYHKIRIALETHLEQMLLKDVFVVAYWSIINQVPDDIRQQHLLLPREYGRFWQRMLLEAQAVGEIRADLDARLVRLLLIGSTIYALDWFKPDGRNTPTEIADVLTEMFFYGVIPRQKSAGAPARRKKAEILSPAQRSDGKSAPVGVKAVKSRGASSQAEKKEKPASAKSTQPSKLRIDPRSAGKPSHGGKRKFSKILDENSGPQNKAPDDIGSATRKMPKKSLSAFSVDVREASKIKPSKPNIKSKKMPTQVS